MQKLYFSPNTLRKLSFIRLNSRICSDPIQKEISGSFYVNRNNHLVISPKKIRGRTESVDLPNEPLTFHTHPEAAYFRHQQPYGFPSSPDLEVFVSRPYAILHCVVSVEGIYICTKTNVSKLSKSNIKDLEQIYNNSHNPTEYTRLVNMSKLCHIKYMSWKKAEKSGIYVEVHQK